MPLFLILLMSHAGLMGELFVDLLLLRGLFLLFIWRYSLGGLLWALYVTKLSFVTQAGHMRQFSFFVDSNFLILLKVFDA